MRTSAIWPRVTGTVLPADAVAAVAGAAALVTPPAPVAPPTAALMAAASAGAITRRLMAATVCARAATVIGYTRLPEVTVPAPVVRFACWMVVAIAVGETPRRTTSAVLSWICSCICSTPESVTACTPGMPWSCGTTWVPSCVASSWGGSEDVTASCTTGMELKFSAATSGARAVGGSCAPDAACCTSACLASMSVPNSYWTVMMLMPSLENESYSLTPLVVLIDCSSGVVTLRSTSLGDAPG